MASKELSSGDTYMRDKGIGLAEFTGGAFQVEGTASTDTPDGIRSETRQG